MTFYLSLKSFVEENSLQNVVSDMADIFISASMCFNHKKCRSQLPIQTKRAPTKWYYSIRELLSSRRRGDVYMRYWTGSSLI